MKLTDLNKNIELTNRYIAAVNKIAEAVNNAVAWYGNCIHANADDIRRYLSKSMKVTRATVRVLPLISLEDAVFSLENIANDPGMCKYFAQIVFDTAVRKYEEIYSFVHWGADEGTCIDDDKIVQFAIDEFYTSISK